MSLSPHAVGDPLLPLHGCPSMAGDLGLWRVAQAQGLQPSAGRVGDFSLKEASGPWGQPGCREEDTRGSMLVCGDVFSISTLIR